MSNVPVILVTGASRGLGRGIAQSCARAGFSVAVHCAGNHTAAAETVALCEAAKVNPGQRFEAVRGDLGSTEQRQSVFDQTLAAFVLDPPRAELRARIATRFDQMVDAGGLEEARALTGLARAAPPRSPVLPRVMLRASHEGRGPAVRTRRPPDAAAVTAPLKGSALEARAAAGSALKGLWGGYLDCLSSRPIVTKALTCFVGACG